MLPEGCADHIVDAIGHLCEFPVWNCGCWSCGCSTGAALLFSVTLWMPLVICVNSLCGTVDVGSVDVAQLLLFFSLSHTHLQQCQSSPAIKLQQNPEVTTTTLITAVTSMLC